VNQDFGLWHGSRVDGVVFRDDGAGGGVANDGAQTPGESGISGRRVRLASGACPGGACDSTLTDGAGAFTLWLPFAATGSVGVQATNSSGWRSTGASAGTTAGSYDRASDLLTFTAAAGVGYSGVAFGDVPPNLWAAPGALGVPGGTAALYRHTYTASTQGTVSFTTSETPVPPLPGWGLTLYRDLHLRQRLARARRRRCARRRHHDHVRERAGDREERRPRHGPARQLPRLHHHLLEPGYRADQQHRHPGRHPGVDRVRLRGLCRDRRRAPGHRRPHPIA